MAARLARSAAIQNDRGFDFMARPNSRLVNLNRFPGRPRINMFSRKSNPVKVKAAVLTASPAERRLANLKACATTTWPLAG